MKTKIFCLLFALVLVVSFSLVTAVPATPAMAAGSQYGTLYIASGGTGGAAAWSTTQAKYDTYSAALAGGTQANTSYSQVWKPVNIPLANITAISFWYYLSSAAQADYNAWPVYKQEGKTYTDSTGYVSPYVILQITDGTNVHWVISQPFARDPDTGSGWTAGWEQWQMTDNAAASGGGDPAQALWHDESFTDDGTTGGSGAYPAGWEYLSFFNTPYSGYSVVKLKVAMGDWAFTENQTAYVDDITVTASTTTYAIEPRVFIGTTPYGNIDTAITAASDGNTISVSSGTFTAIGPDSPYDKSIPIDVSKAVTIQSVSGAATAATTIIDPGAKGQGAIKISHDSVTIDGFTVKGGSQAYTASHPQENAIWVAANYATIKNNTIINYRGNQAGIYIGDGQAGVPTGAVFGYIPGTPASSRLGHTIQGNTFRQVNAGEGWGIFAYDLSDSLITGNTFVGDAVWTTNTVAGAPGTAIIIHNATVAAGTPSPGGGSVVIENNTARYLKYTWLSFYAAYMYTDSVGYGYEQPEDSTVDGVIVRNNTVYDCGQTTSFTGGTAVNFHRAKNSNLDCYGVKAADLTVGSNFVTIGPGNTFYNLAYGVKVDAPTTCTDSSGYACVLSADKIVVKYNAIYGCASYGLYNGTIGANQEGGGALTVAALYNWWGKATGAYHATTNPGVALYRGATVTDSVTYSPWLYLTTLANGGSTITTLYANSVPAYAKSIILDVVGWNTFSVPIGLDGQYNTWAKLYTLTSLPYTVAYRFDTASQTFVALATTNTYALAPGEGLYIKMTATSSIPYCYSTEFSIPSRNLSAGWDFIGGGMTTQDADDVCVSIATTGSTAGYTHIISPAENAGTPWVWIYDTGGTANDIVLGEGYWVFLPIARTLGLFDLTPVTWVP